MTVTYSIGTLSRLSGVNVEMIRYYEKVALLPATARDSNGYRQYDNAFVERLAFIRHGRELGFTIDEMRDLLTLEHHSERPCADADRMTRARLDILKSDIRDLQRMWRALRQEVNCHSRPVEHCEPIRALEKPNAQSRS
ncbi:MerR family transcriptional regulator [Caballeronia terrestris]|uniref:MerR family transcriptional regulator n=1 Tax=Caballeronia terrestris TaxID=1226301 RepID=A0A158K8B9_9BURK|nr:MerR family DNA-binding protein [Caballeronia terrestris]SAL77362.1 MerR family transcriptional regulator [Caballeronia terrestris]